MDRSVRSRTSSTSSLRSPAGPSTPAPTPAGQITPGPPISRHPHRVPSPDQLVASLSRLRAERALSNPATPAPTPNPSAPHQQHTLHPDAIIAGLSSLGGDEGIASGSVPGTPAPTPFSPSPSITQHIQPEQIAASIARLREEGVVSLANTQPGTPSTTPAYPPHPGLAQVHNLGIIPEHLAEGIAGLDAGRDEGLDSGSNPCTPIPTPLSPSPAQHSVLAEQLAAGIHRLKVEEGMSSGGSSGMPATPAPTPFSHGPGGVRPEDLAAGISRLSVIQEAADTSPQVAINVLEATETSANASNLSNYFGSPHSSGDSIFDQLSAPPGMKGRSRSNSSSGAGFHDVTINTPAKRFQNLGSTPASPQVFPTSSSTPSNYPLGRNSVAEPPFSSTPTTGSETPTGSVTPISSPPKQSTSSTKGLAPQQLDINALAVSQQDTHAAQYGAPSPRAAPLSAAEMPAETVSPSVDLVSPASSISIYATPAAQTPVVEMQPTGFPSRNTEAPIQPPAGLSAPPPPRPESPVVSKTGANSYNDAWMPKPACKEVLDNMANTPGTYYPSRDQLTCPGVAPGSDQGDPVRDLVAKYQGEGEACKRHTLAADGVTTDYRGLQQLIAAGNYRAAINLTAQLLEMYGQGKGKAGQLSKHSQSSLQIWYTRLALLVKLKLYTVAETEASHFGELDKPDVFYQYYPELYGGRRGSVAPWNMRLLIAQIPGLAGKHVHSMNRLFSLLFSVRDMVKNIEQGLAPDGLVWLDATEEDKSQALECWRERERQVLYSLINNSISCSDFDSAVKQFDMLILVEKESRKAALYSAYGRLYLQIGNLARADKFFAQAASLRDNQKTGDNLEGFLDSAFLAIGQGQFAAALERFQSALAISSSDKEKVIRNNISVCLLYLGRLKEGLQFLENSVTADTANIQGNPILNLCTLYELESSYALQKKIGMLGLVSIHCSDSFPTSSLKL